MPHHHKLSLLAAIFININIMLGTGFFINTVVLTQEAGSLGAFIYILVAILLLPLVISIAGLVEHSGESSTFYDFGKHVSPFFGFLSSWSYFTGKLCSAALGIHVCLSFLQRIIPALQALPIIPLDIAAIMLFTGLNLMNLQIGKQIQFTFIILKIVPILFVIFTGLYLFNPGHFIADTAIWSGVST